MKPFLVSPSCIFNWCTYSPGFFVLRFGAASAGMWTKSTRFLVEFNLSSTACAIINSCQPSSLSSWPTQYPPLLLVRAFQEERLPYSCRCLVIPLCHYYQIPIGAES